jgi:hypothetical protein
MSIPLATTTIKVLRPQPGTDDDPWVTSDDSDDKVIASGIRAHIGSPNGDEITSGGSQVIKTFRLDCDITDLSETDRIIDEKTLITYDVTWVQKRYGVGLDHIEAGLLVVSGVTV